MADEIVQDVVDDKAISQPEVVSTTPEPVDTGSPKSDDAINDARDALAQLKFEKAAPGESDEAFKERKAKGNPYRGDNGQFASKPKEEVKSIEAAPVKAAPEKIAAQDLDPKVKPQASTPAGTPPGRWADDAKQIWPTLPPAAQSAVLKAEAEINETGRRWSEEKQQLLQAIEPARQSGQRYGMQPNEVIKNLIAADDLLNSDPIAGLQWIAQQKGVDLNQFLSNGTPAPAPRQSVDLSPLVNRLSALEQHISSQNEAQGLSLVDAFAEKNPHFNDVSNEVFKLIPVIKGENPNAAPSVVLEKAYESALWLNPTVRDRLIQEKTETAAKAKQDETAKKFAQSRSAAVSIKGSPNGQQSGSPKANGKDDVYSDVREAMNQLKTAV